ncbi:low-density lipoprotein receptor class A domain-containing protein 4-like [Lethenteron reissneri]|uniref:low-density lipoprotein receptor class A domain-containing protein 4-like n=1 Tax=Lethenteron reissneri TaxID=7753 RepID=UPI002AB69876|nr:low-density lipoprotein receptor class A domain-containing protein 4-like [Lethenteron reissneri]
MAGVAAMVFLPCSLLHHHHLLLDSRPTPPLLTHTMGSGLWPADRAASQTASSHQPLVCGGGSATGGPPAVRDPFARPGGGLKYPYSSSEVDLPPTIALSDGEEPPPYKGPCSLRLRNHEQQLEINREAIRPPPNRTVFDSDYWPHFRPPSCRAGVSAGGARGGGDGGGPPRGLLLPPPPSYSEALRHCLMPVAVTATGAKAAAGPAAGTAAVAAAARGATGAAAGTKPGAGAIAGNSGDATGTTAAAVAVDGGGATEQETAVMVVVVGMGVGMGVGGGQPQTNARGRTA